MHRLRAPGITLTLSAALACAGDDGATGTSTSAATTATTFATTTATTATTATTSSTTTTTTATTTTTTGSGNLCDQDECVRCHQLDGVGGLTGHICDNLLWSCGYPSPCPAVPVTWIEPGVYEVGDVDAASCAVTAMMGPTPARIELAGIVEAESATIYVVGDGTALFQWSYAGGDVVQAVRSGRLVLQPAGYFETCLVDPTAAALGSCLLGGHDPCGDPWTWTPPWSTGECGRDVPDGCTMG